MSKTAKKKSGKPVPKQVRASIRDPVGFDEDDITWAEPEGTFRQPDTSPVFMLHNDLNNYKNVRKPILLAREPDVVLPGCPDFAETGDPNPHAKLQLEERHARTGVGLRGLRLAEAPEILGPGLDLGYDNVGRDAYQDLFVPEAYTIDKIRGRRILPLNLENATPSATAPFKCDNNDTVFRPIEPGHLRKTLIVEPGTYKRAVQDLINTGDAKSLRDALRSTHKTQTAKASGSSVGQAAPTQGAGGVHQNPRAPMVDTAAAQRDNPRLHSTTAETPSPSQSQQTGGPTGVSSLRPAVTLRPEKGSPDATDIYQAQQAPQSQTRARIGRHIKGRQIGTGQLKTGHNNPAPQKQALQSQRAVPEEIIRVRPNKPASQEGMEAPGRVTSRQATKTHTPDIVERVRSRPDPESQTGSTRGLTQRRVNQGRDLSKTKRTPVESSGLASGPSRNSRHSDTVSRKSGSSKAASARQKVGMNLRFQVGPAARGNQYEFLESSSNLDDEDDDGTERYAYYTR